MKREIERVMKLSKRRASVCDSLDWTSPRGTGRCCGWLETLPTPSDKRISDNPSHGRIRSPPDPEERHTDRERQITHSVLGLNE